MFRHHFAFVAAAAALVSALPAQAALPKLVGTVGPGFDISLKQGGVAVKRLKPGKYTFVVVDRSSMHNFHLIGRGVNIDSGIGRRSTKTYTITLRAGTYRFLCDPHELAMKGTFRVSP